jgi:CRP-like cAMP-binding protein
MSAHTLLMHQFSLLRLLSAEALEQIAPLATLRDFAKREMVLTKGPPVPFLCFLMEGRLQAIDFTLDGREVGLYFIEEGDYFGELSLIDGGSQPEFVIATGRARVVLLPGNEIRPILFSSPQLAEALSRRLAQRVRHQLSQRQILSVTNPLHRICAQLQIMINVAPGQPPQQVIIKAPTHQELAIMVNLTRETVTRTFQVLQAQGVLTRQGDELRVDQAKLEKLASGEKQED